MLSMTIIPERPFSMQVIMPSRTVEFLFMTGSTHRFVCFAFSTSDMGTCGEMIDVMIFLAYSWSELRVSDTVRLIHKIGCKNHRQIEIFNMTYIL